jgi:hypothetical protein
MADIQDRIRRTVEHVYELLVQGRYDALEDITRGVRLSAKEMEFAVKQYPYPLQARPSDAPIDVVEITGSSPRAWSVRADAYTAREGRSDLTLELTVVQEGSDDMRVELDDLHVL